MARRLARSVERPKQNVIAVGLRGVGDYDAYRDAIESLGLALESARDPESMNKLVRDRKSAAVVVYCPKGSDCAREVLRRLAEGCSGLPLVVLTEDADFGEYYDLMSRGAAAYMGVSEGPERLARTLCVASGHPLPSERARGISQGQIGQGQAAAS